MSVGTEPFFKESAEICETPPCYSIKFPSTNHSASITVMASETLGWKGIVVTQFGTFHREAVVGKVVCNLVTIPVRSQNATV